DVRGDRPGAGSGRKAAVQGAGSRRDGGSVQGAGSGRKTAVQARVYDVSPPLGAARAQDVRSPSGLGAGSVRPVPSSSISSPLSSRAMRVAPATAPGMRNTATK